MSVLSNDSHFGSFKGCSYVNMSSKKINFITLYPHLGSSQVLDVIRLFTQVPPGTRPWAKTGV